MIGQKVTVKVAGKKYRGRVTAADRNTELLEIGPDGPGRNFIPGLTAVTLTIDLDPRPVKKKAKGELKLYRVKSQRADYDDLQQMVVWARSRRGAREIASSADRGETEGIVGAWCPPYTVTEIEPRAGVVLAHTLAG